MPSLTQMSMVVLSLTVAALMKHAREAQWLSMVKMFVSSSRKLRQAANMKKVTPVVRTVDTVAWPEPTWTPDNEKIIWGFWDAGEDKMSALCRFATESWSVRNPTWTVIIVSDHSYQQYVSFNDIPTTFQSLLPQHRSDIVRTALLLRYGGVYLDVSTFMYKGLDQVWNQLDPDTLALTSILSYPESGFEVYNNAVLMARKPNNPVLREWQRRFLAYMEDPCLTFKQVLEHPQFQRVRQFIVHRSNGILKDMAPYGALLWMLSDMIWHEPTLRPHIIKLPFHEWGFAQFTLTHVIRKVRLERRYGGLIPPSESENAVVWTLLGMLKNTMTLLPYHFAEDMDLVSRLTTTMTLVKFSTLGTDHFSLNSTSVLSQFSQASKDVATYPTMQATLEGAQRLDNHTNNYSITGIPFAGPNHSPMVVRKVDSG
jgi:hypothetical protein